MEVSVEIDRQDNGPSAAAEPASKSLATPTTLVVSCE